MACRSGSSRALSDVSRPRGLTRACPSLALVAALSTARRLGACRSPRKSRGSSKRSRRTSTRPIPVSSSRSRETTLYRHAARVIQWAALGFIAGLVLLVLHVHPGPVGSASSGSCDARRACSSSSATSASSARPGCRASPARCSGGGLEGFFGEHGRALARALAPRRHTDRVGGVLGRPGGPALRLHDSQLRYWERVGLVAPQRPTRSTASAISSRCASSLAARRRPAVARGSASRSGPLVEPGDDIAGLRLVTDGRPCGRVTTTARSSDALRSGQLALFVAVDRLAAEVDAEVQRSTPSARTFVERLHEAPTGEASGEAGRLTRRHVAEPARIEPSPPANDQARPGARSRGRSRRRRPRLVARLPASVRRRRNIAAVWSCASSINGGPGGARAVRGRVAERELDRCRRRLRLDAGFRELLERLAHAPSTRSRAIGRVPAAP